MLDALREPDQSIDEALDIDVSSDILEIYDDKEKKSKAYIHSLR